MVFDTFRTNIEPNGDYLMKMYENTMKIYEMYGNKKKIDEN